MGFLSGLLKGGAIGGVFGATVGGLEGAGAVSFGSLTGERQQEAGNLAASQLRGLAGTVGQELDPFSQAGTTAQSALLGALGLGGEGFDPSIIFDNPQFKARLEGATEGLGAAQSRLGLVDSSATRRKAATQGALLAGNAFQDFISNLGDIVGRGQQAAQAKVGAQTELQKGAIEAELAGRLGKAEAKKNLFGSALSLGTTVLGGL